MLAVVVGQTVSIYNRPFYIYELDNFTKAFYWKNFGITEFNPQDTTQRTAPAPKMVSTSLDIFNYSQQN